MPRTIYFDYNATTPLDADVRSAMLPFLAENWGNPSSVHHVGQKARAQLDDARDRAAKFLGAKPSEIIFTSGGTEANNLAIFGTARALKAKGKHLVTAAVEHHAVLQCFDYLDQTGHLLVVLEGNFEEEQPTELQMESLRRLVAFMGARHGITPEMIGSHKDFAETLCPGKHLYERMTEIKQPSVAR